ncbi:hypothetical protein [Lentzea sp. NPDC004782]|uniref:hypothetical protein n=1 Tax=Lentzea sp. NPDC004782 TaxID=3154458 RepID=UPI0033AFA0EF
MARVLRMLNLKIRTDRGWQAHEYNLDAQVVVIHGPADTGKSSIPDAIGFALGVDNVPFRGAVHRLLREVELKIRLGNRTYTLRRSRSSSSRVEVTDEVGDLVGRFAAGQTRAEATTMSEWLLDNLGLTEGFSALGPKSTFHSAVWPYLHRSQFDIDRHIVLPSSSDRLRLDALEFLTGITNPELTRRRKELEAIDREIGTRQRRSTGIVEFLAESQATDPAAVRAALTDLAVQEKEAEARLAQLRASANAAVAHADQWQQRRLAAYNRVNNAEQNLLRAVRDLGEVQLELDKVNECLRAVGVLEDADPADRRTLELVADKRECPECEADLLAIVPPPGHCSLCCRPLRGQEHLETRIRLQKQRQEIELRMPALSDAEKAARRAAETARVELVGLLTTQNEQTEQAVAPHVDAIAGATAELAALRQQLKDLTQIDTILQRLDDDQLAITKLREEQENRYAELSVAEEAYDNRDDVAEALTDIFRRTIKSIEPPNSTGLARIDAKTLLPWVDEQPFESRGGGARVAVSVAYSLSLLSYTLETDQCGLPGLLIIDSPQKNLGTNDPDRGLARRVYQKFLDALQERGAIGDGRFERPFQLIIVDNDRPKVKGLRLVHKLDYGDGFIKDLDDPHGIPAGDVPLPFEDEADDE